MTKRTLFILLALGCWTISGVLLAYGLSGAMLGDERGSRWLTLFVFAAFFGGIYFIFSAFSKSRHKFGYDHDVITTFSCPNCKAELNYSLFPAFSNEMPCPKCGQMVTSQEQRTGASFKLVQAPELQFELASQEGSSSSPASAEAVRAALGQGQGFEIADDPEGWLSLTSTVGPPRYVPGPPPGGFKAEKHVARLKLLTPKETPVLPESLTLSSTELNLTINVCTALAAAFGPYKLRIVGIENWVAVTPDGESLGAELVMQQFKLRGMANR